MADEGANAMDEAVRLDNENGEEQLADNGPPIEANVDIINPGVVEGAEGEQLRPAAGSEASDADAGGRQIELQAWDLTEEENREYDRVIAKLVAYNEGRGEALTVEENQYMHALAVRIKLEDKSKDLEMVQGRVEGLTKKMDQVELQIQRNDKETRKRIESLGQGQQALRLAMEVTVAETKKVLYDHTATMKRELVDNQAAVKLELEASHARAQESTEGILKKMGEQIDILVAGHKKAEETKGSKKENEKIEPAAPKGEEAKGEDATPKPTEGEDGKHSVSSMRTEEIRSVSSAMGDAKKGDSDRENQRKNLVKWPVAKVIAEVISKGGDPANIKWKTETSKELRNALPHFKALKDNKEYTTEQIRELMTVTSAHAVKDRLDGDTIMNYVRTHLKGDVLTFIDSLRDEQGVDDEYLWYQVQLSGGRTKSTADASKELNNLINHPDNLTFNQVVTKIPQLVKYKSGSSGQSDRDKIWQNLQSMEAMHSFLTQHIRSNQAQSDIQEYYEEASKAIRDGEEGLKPRDFTAYLKFCNKVMTIPSIKDIIFKPDQGAKAHKMAGMNSGAPEQQQVQNGKSGEPQVSGMNQGGAVVVNGGGAQNQNGMFRAARPWGQGNPGQGYMNGGGHVQHRQQQPHGGGANLPPPHMQNGMAAGRPPPPFPGNTFQARFNGPPQGNAAFGQGGNGNNNQAQVQPIPQLPWDQLSKWDQGRCFPENLKGCCWNCAEPSNHVFFRCPYHNGATPKDPRTNPACGRCHGYHPGACHLERQGGAQRA